jgi:hypothetical protein
VRLSTQTARPWPPLHSLNGWSADLNAYALALWERSSASVADRARIGVETRCRPNGCRRAARIRNTSCRCRPAMSGRIPGRRGARPGQTVRSRRRHGGRPPASPGQGRRPRRRAGRTRQQPRPGSAGLPGLTPGTARMLTRSRRRALLWLRSPGLPGPRGPRRAECCWIRKPRRPEARPGCSRRMRLGAMPCLLDAWARRQAPVSGPPGSLVPWSRRGPVLTAASASAKPGQPPPTATAAWSARSVGGGRDRACENGIVEANGQFTFSRFLRLLPRFRVTCFEICPRP